LPPPARTARWLRKRGPAGRPADPSAGRSSGIHRSQRRLPVGLGHGALRYHVRAGAARETSPGRHSWSSMRSIHAHARTQRAKGGLQTAVDQAADEAAWRVVSIGSPCGAPKPGMVG
jgi:hypothetical protein